MCYHEKTGVDETKGSWSSDSGRTMNNGWAELWIQDLRLPYNLEKVEKGSWAGRNSVVRPSRVMKLQYFSLIPTQSLFNSTHFNILILTNYSHMSYVMSSIIDKLGLHECSDDEVSVGVFCFQMNA